MSRKHYRQLAEIIAKAKSESDPVRVIATGLARIFKADNPRFDYGKFFAACEVEPAV
jgi:hypothetical protein